MVRFGGGREGSVIIKERGGRETKEEERGGKEDN